MFVLVLTTVFGFLCFVAVVLLGNVGLRFVCSLIVCPFLGFGVFWVLRCFGFVDIVLLIFGFDI